ncbi:MAG: hypothetical protein ACD_70C00107G0011 [uncultured bacterium]|nr:MAG: hypothetical protein ACD_70C00107G0011 [uncultured bacterium]OGT26085.1 MAG: hypothetical protein A3B71_04300 [Gammaproteobacteria bacterium RIFCSPHIGHO2_02_FULL_42_43]OGT29370.1 MAG: hypothetical protein A2624_02300 [Gammaproteobacteria bacterium RIFCSPHIGHO2_01_FULL_42_8]OGT50893.1 MAG: hypothetical protein A3E54_03930 [Gammaproteobacteria bacterium RIFCSPHIGHO2_12_FULL_41_25]OGT62827.1 MAG: hypothetical protein A3I77_00195 [Gammaproteobacteria bacterium RIFCSPLOWO2_02_FULL_42_14]OGT
MIDTTHIPTLDEAKAYIDAIDFSMVVDKIVSTKGWKKSDVLKIGELYKHFLYLNKKYTNSCLSLPPSEEVDEFWHNHILDTKKYHTDCDKIFGAYLHHYPYFGIDGKTTRNDLDNAFEKTQALHFQEFGDYIYNVRYVHFKQLINFIKLLFTAKQSNR